ncbi:hypothetical protein SAMN05192574_102908 [Mucilaginibacter gossypiicola]|uniref:RiboL-PSP-HEPN domain-containing protein n=1 Tax=Mucilaginibacter gossypiicola TaxID=551995 RepID=A0A1H8EZZ1_9SPHI|nr:HEPN domain-containing protein [Mucilaginibacter gossypiicola]SEN25035.1 hypothetical protein SAMN05192574_102908 [Mucilaginibacter gossypiicola]
MLSAKRQFDESMSRVNELDSLFTHLNTTLRFPSASISDLLRSEVVYSVSALDKLIHELVKEGMVEIFLLRRPRTSAYSKFPLTLDIVNNINLGVIPPELVFARHISESHRHLSFQDPDKISSILPLIWAEPHKWQTIALAMGLTEADVKTKLKNIVIRRNQIVHESDLDLSTGDIQPISQTDVRDIVQFIVLLGNTIFSLVA